MLSYLVSSQARRRLLVALWRDRQEASVRKLAQESDLTLQATQRELRLMADAGLACMRVNGNAHLYRAHRAHPQAALLEALMSAPAEAAPPCSAPRAEPSEDRVYGWLRHLDVPLMIDEPPEEPPSVELALAAAARVARRDPQLARVLPYLVYTNRHDLDWEALKRSAHEQGERHAVGFMVDVAGYLTGNRALRRHARELRDQRRQATHDFFRTAATTPRARTLAETRTPPLARRWGFRMNMPLDSFADVFRTHGQSDLHTH